MVARRRLMVGAAAGLAAGLVPRLGAATAWGQAASPFTPGADPEAPQLNDVVAEGYRRDVIIRWGDPVLANAPPFTPDDLTEIEAARQFGWDGIIAGIVTPPQAQDGVARLVMVVGHPDVSARMVFADGRDRPRIAGKLQGASVLNLSYRGGRWVVVDGGYQSRRISDGTLCTITGPAAAVIGQSVQGILAPGLGCVTPWNTVLLPEGRTAPWIMRLAGRAAGFSSPTVGAGFGWVAEIDALNPTSFPAKRTALGRMPRAGVACGLAADGSAVVFMTEDAPMGRLFRFKGAAPVGDGSGALDAGTLAVAMIEGSAIVWRDLPGGIPSLTATLSAARDGARFDAPAGLAIGPDGTVFLACSGNPGRGVDQVDALNPRSGNGAGHVLALTPAGGDLAAARFAGRAVLLGGNPNTDPSARYTPGSLAWLRSPYSLNFDAAHRLYIGTDQGGAVSDTADGLFTMEVSGFGRYALDMLYLAPIGGAIGAAGFGPRGRDVFTVARHPGATPNADFAHPATRWPTVQPDMPPQTTLVSLAR
ncbi:PhoX family protein [Acidiphilium sp.]|uniref:PhoX family protein n=1 Tax=Acidiphilium sp. TaxID=527 RepID=UPI003D091CA8